MWRGSSTAVLLLAITGCVSSPKDPSAGGCFGHGNAWRAPSVPGLQGAYGQNVPMAAPYAYAPPGSRYQAQQMMARSIPLNMVQTNMAGAPGMPPMPIPPGGVLTPAGVPFLPTAPGGIAQAGASGNPMGGVVQANIPPGMLPQGGVIPAQFTGGPGAASHQRYALQRTQIKFNQPYGMKVAWFGFGPDQKPMYSPVPIQTPGHYNFAQGAVYRLKLSNIEGRPGLELYPTMEVAPTNPHTEAFLSHNSVPIDFRQEDFKQVLEGNFVTKVIYLPHPQFQDLAGTGTGEILSTQLEPGTDPIREAERRGNILLIIRMGNILQELEHSPPLGAPAPQAQAPVMDQQMPLPNKLPMQMPYFGAPGQQQIGPPPGMPSVPVQIPHGPGAGLPPIPGHHPGTPPPQGIPGTPTNLPVHPGKSANPPGTIPPGLGSVPALPEKQPTAKTTTPPKKTVIIPRYVHPVSGPSAPGALVIPTNPLPVLEMNETPPTMAPGGSATPPGRVNLDSNGLPLVAPPPMLGGSEPAPLPIFPSTP